MYENSHFLGKAAEYAVASKLLLRSIPVHLPLVDVGVDLIAGDSIRVQVKSARKRRKTGDYIFHLSHCRHLKKGDVTWRHTVRHWPTVVDFIVFWACDDDKFWIVPSREFSERAPSSIALSGPGGRKIINHEETDRLLSQGLSALQVSRILKVGKACITRYQSGATKGGHPQPFDFKKYENAWHEIESAVAVARQVNSLDGVDDLMSPSELEAAYSFIAKDA